jgi:uncharacterized protein (TIGR02246 family)
VGAALLAGGVVATRVPRPAAEAGQDVKRHARVGDAPRRVARLSPEAARAEEQAIRKSVAAFTAAFNKADLDHLLSAWTGDAEFLSGSGHVYRGKAQLRTLLEKALARHKGSKQTVKVTSIRFIKPDVALEEGVVTLTSQEGAVDSGHYESLWVKAEGKWYLSRVRDLPEAMTEDRPIAYHKLGPLSWMVGEWVDKDGVGDVKLSCKWGPGQTSILQEFTVKRAGGKLLHVTQRIGWDPGHGQVRSWVFDSTGGFGGGLWTREGNSWAIASEGVFADGRPSSSADRWKYVNDATMTWTSTNREADEKPLPDVEVTLIKKKAPPAAGRLP